LMLFKIEAIFRRLKTSLSLSPVFHHKEDHVTGHFDKLRTNEKNDKLSLNHPL
jgi:hypothetical protein